MGESRVLNDGVSGVSAIVTAYQRTEQTLFTLSKLLACSPPPEEVLVHVDGAQMECEEVIRKAYPNVHVLRSTIRVGPGGARNKLVGAVTNDLVASFDDDSYPIDADYFNRVKVLSQQFDDASIFSATVYERDERVRDDSRKEEWTADFFGGACIFRRSDFLGAGGFVPLLLAYGMEEVDLALRLHARCGKILRSSWLRVYHDTNLERHSDAEVTSASIANIALLTYLRYPLSLWPVGFLQIGNRIRWLLRYGRYRGILTGVAMIPAHLRKHRQYCARITSRSMRSYLALRRRPIATRVD